MEKFLLGFSVKLKTPFTPVKCVNDAQEVQGMYARSELFCFFITNIIEICSGNWTKKWMQEVSEGNHVALGLLFWQVQCEQGDKYL